MLKLPTLLCKTIIAFLVLSIISTFICKQNCKHHTRLPENNTLASYSYIRPQIIFLKMEYFRFAQLLSNRPHQGIYNGYFTRNGFRFFCVSASNDSDLNCPFVVPVAFFGTLESIQVRHKRLRFYWRSSIFNIGSKQSVHCATIWQFHGFRILTLVFFSKLYPLGSILPVDDQCHILRKYFPRYVIQSFLLLVNKLK